MSKYLQFLKLKSTERVVTTEIFRRWQPESYPRHCICISKWRC